ncbi:hypothetical protein J7E70_32825 [Variovorax paradoxus]|nr:hypothetical protein [Variovorax paradoxus]
MIDVMWAMHEYDATSEVSRLQVPTAVAGQARIEIALPCSPLRVPQRRGLHFSKKKTAHNR